MNRMIAMTIRPAQRPPPRGDLALAVQQPATGGDEDERERPQQLA